MIYRPTRTSALLALVFAGVLLPYTAAEAATRTWTGLGTDNNWSTAANWGGVAPSAGDDLVFPGGTPRLSPNNDFAANTSFNTISFTGSSGGYTLGGNAIDLVAGISATNSSGTNRVSLPLTLTASQTFSCSIPAPIDRLSIGIIALGSFTLTFNPAAGSVIEELFGGGISGTGGVTASGSGVVFIDSACTYSGPTNVTAGNFVLNGVSLNTASVVTVSGGILQYANSSSTGSVTVDNGATLLCGGGGTNQIGSVTNLTLQSGSTLNMAMYSATNYGQLNASGPVALGGAILALSWIFVSSTGNAFTIINNSSGSAVTGTFSGLPEGATFAQNGREYRITYVGGTGHSVVVTDIGAVPTATPTSTPTSTATPTNTPTATSTAAAAVVPTLSPGLLMFLGLALAVAALFLIRRSG